MPRFCKCGSDMFICQECGRDLCSRGCGEHILDTEEASEWIEGKGNVCNRCLSRFYIQKQDKSWVRIQPVKPICLKGNPAYDLMM